MPERRYAVADFTDLDAVRCPCGWARRAFGKEADGIASMHVVDIECDSRVHFHRSTTELYYVLEGEGVVELDGDRVPVRAGTAVLIKPGCRHRAVGRLRILNVPVPAFDPDDEWFA